jgi:hypothetical protein
MSENIKFNKIFYSKDDYSKVINTSFTQLGIQTPQQEIQQQPSIEEFFDLYNTLFYTIPEFGNSNSHEFLIKKSSEYINFSSNMEEIVLLQEEIAQLRIDLLDSQKQVIQLQTGVTSSIF